MSFFAVHANGHVIVETTRRQARQDAANIVRNEPAYDGVVEVDNTTRDTYQPVDAFPGKVVVEKSTHLVALARVPSVAVSN